MTENKQPKPADAQCKECSIDQPYEKEIMAGGVLCGGCGRTRPNVKYILDQPNAGEQGKGMRWVKASERLPEGGYGKYHWRFTGKINEPCSAGVAYLCIHSSGKNKPKDVEWLDESLTSLKEDQEAIEFAEWINENNYLCTSIPMQKEKYWQQSEYDHRADKLTEGKEITTQQLYKLYKESK